MQEIKANNARSMFQQLEMHMKDILGKEPTKQNALQDVDEKFLRKRQVREAYAIFKNPSKLSTASDT